MPTTYCNTDLELVSTEDLSRILAFFKGRSVPPLYDAVRGEDGRWYATFETSKQFTEPDSNIAAMLTAIESMRIAERRMWRACTKREFNIGYDCGSEPWAFNHGLSAETLRRIAKIQGSLRITLYPERPAKRPSKRESRKKTK